MNQTQIIDAANEGLFTQQEWSERRRHIATLKNFAGASVAAANALAAIRDKKLYRPHKTLKEFCQHECGWSEQRLFQILKFASIRSSLPSKTKQLLSRESHARELINVPEDQREEVLEEAQHSTGGARKVTAKDIRAAAKSVASPDSQSANGAADVDASGRAIPKPTLKYWNRRTEAAEILAQLRYSKTKLKSLDLSDPMWIEVNLNAAIGELQGVISRFSKSVPNHLCPYCEGLRPDKCAECHGRGCVSEFFWKTAIPSDIKEKAEKHASRPF